VAGVTALFFLSGVPRVQRDILQVLSSMYYPNQAPGEQTSHFPDKGVSRWSTGFWASGK